MICKNCDGHIESMLVVNGEQVDPLNCSYCNAIMHNDCASKCLLCGKDMCFECSVKNQYTCSECKFKTEIVEEPLSMEFISSTMFESFLKCPYSFKQEFILNTLSEEERQNKYSVIGNLLHDLFEKYSVIRPLNDELLRNITIEYEEMFDRLPFTLFNDEDDFNRFKALHIMTVCNWYKKEVTMEIPLFTECQHFVELHKDLPPIRVTLDRINGNIDNPENWEVWDYKTGKVYAADKLRTTMQLPIYALAIKKLYGQAPKFLTLHFPQHDNTLRTFERLTDDIYTCKVTRGGTYTISLTERLNKMVEIYAEIKKNKFDYNIKDSHYCNNYCPIGSVQKCNGISNNWINSGERWKT